MNKIERTASVVLVDDVAVIAGSGMGRASGMETAFDRIDGI